MACYLVVLFIHNSIVIYTNCRKIFICHWNLYLFSISDIKSIYNWTPQTSHLRVRSLSWTEKRRKKATQSQSLLCLGMSSPSANPPYPTHMWGAYKDVRAVRACSPRSTQCAPGKNKTNHVQGGKQRWGSRRKMLMFVRRNQMLVFVRRNQRRGAGGD